MSEDRDYANVELLKKVGHLHYFRDTATGEEFCELGTPGIELDAVRDESRVQLYVEFSDNPSAVEILALRKFSHELGAVSLADLKQATRPGQRFHIKECFLVEAEREVRRGEELGLAIRFDLLK